MKSHPLPNCYATSDACVEDTRMVVMVTGGSGLVGEAIKPLVANAHDGAQYVFLSSKDGDLRYGIT